MSRPAVRLKQDAATFPVPQHRDQVIASMRRDTRRI